MRDFFDKDAKTIYKKVVGDNGLERVREYTKPLNAKTTDESAKLGNIGELAAMRAITLWRLMARLEPAGCVDYRIYQVTESEFNRKEFDLVEEWRMDDGKKYRRVYEVKCEKRTLNSDKPYYKWGKMNPAWLYATNGETVKTDGTGNITLGDYYPVLVETEAELDNLMRGDGFIYQGRYLFSVGYVEKKAGGDCRGAMLKTDDGAYLTYDGFRKSGEPLEVANDAEMFTALCIPVKHLFRVAQRIVKSGTEGVGRVKKDLGNYVPITKLLGFDARSKPVYGKPSRTGACMYPVITSGLVYDNDPTADNAQTREQARKRYEYRWTKAGMPFAEADREEAERVALINPLRGVMKRYVISPEDNEKCLQRLDAKQAKKDIES